jgi:hypothetical protein
MPSVVAERHERGDVPSRVLITVMTAEYGHGALSPSQGTCCYRCSPTVVLGVGLSVPGRPPTDPEWTVVDFVLALVALVPAAVPGIVDIPRGLRVGWHGTAAQGATNRPRSARLGTASYRRLSATEFHSHSRITCVASAVWPVLDNLGALLPSRLRELEAAVVVAAVNALVRADLDDSPTGSPIRRDATLDREVDERSRCRRCALRRRRRTRFPGQPAHRSQPRTGRPRVSDEQYRDGTLGPRCQSQRHIPIAMLDLQVGTVRHRGSAGFEVGADVGHADQGRTSRSKRGSAATRLTDRADRQGLIPRRPTASARTCDGITLGG